MRVHLRDVLLASMDHVHQNVENCGGDPRCTRANATSIKPRSNERGNSNQSCRLRPRPRNFNGATFMERGNLQVLELVLILGEASIEPR